MLICTDISLNKKTSINNNEDFESIEQFESISNRRENRGLKNKQNKFLRASKDCKNNRKSRDYGFKSYKSLINNTENINGLISTNNNVEKINNMYISRNENSEKVKNNFHKSVNEVYSEDFNLKEFIKNKMNKTLRIPVSQGHCRSNSTNIYQYNY